MDIKYHDYFKRLQGKQHDELAIRLTVAAELAVNRPHTPSQLDYLPAVMHGDQVREFRDMIAQRADDKPLANQANLAVLREIVAYLDKYCPDSATVSVQWIDPVYPVTMIHILRPAAPLKSEEKEEENIVCQVIDMADFEHLRSDIRLRNLRAA